MRLYTLCCVCFYQQLWIFMTADLTAVNLVQKGDTKMRINRTHSNSSALKTTNVPRHVVLENGDFVNISHLKNGKPYYSLNKRAVLDIGKADFLSGDHKNEGHTKTLNGNKLKLNQKCAKRISRSASNPDYFSGQYNKNDHSLCSSPMDLVRSEETYKSIRFDEFCVYDFHCFNCFSDEKRYNCKCDLMCWFYGDCCFDFYLQCLGLRIDADDSEILKAIMKKMISESQVQRFFRSYQMLNYTSCSRTSHASQESFLVNKCGESLEIKRRFKEVYDDLFNVPDSSVRGMSMEDVERRCEHPSFSLNLIDNIPKAYALGIQKFQDQHPQRLHFYNRFCSYCNGIHPKDSRDWSSYVICPNNKTITIFDSESFSEFNEIMRAFNCTMVYSAPLIEKDRFCFTHKSETQNSDLRNGCNNLLVNLSNTSQSKKSDENDICLSYKLCQRYSLRFTDVVQNQQYSNPHCFRVLQKNISYGVKIRNQNGGSCRYYVNPCDYGIAFSFDHHLESLRQLFQFKSPLNKKDTANTACNSGDIYVAELNTCSKVTCSNSSFPILGKCFKRLGMSEIMSNIVRVQNNFKPVQLRSIRPSNVTGIKLIMSFKNLLKEPAINGIDCQSFFKSSFVEQMLTNKTLILLYWKSCIVDPEKRELDKDIFYLYSDLLNVKNLNINDFKIVSTSQCSLLGEIGHNCTITVATTNDNKHIKKERHFFRKDACRNGFMESEEYIADACLVFNLESNEYEPLLTKLRETYARVKESIYFEHLQLIKITVKVTENTFNESKMVASDSSDSGSFHCGFGRTLRNVPLRVTVQDHLGEVVFISQKELPEKGHGFLLTWSVDEATDKVYPDTVVMPLCVAINATAECPSDEFVRISYEDVIFDQSHVMVSDNKTVAYDFLENLDILASAKDVEVEIKKHFGDSLIYIVPKSHYILLDTGFLVCTSFLSNPYNKEALYEYTFVPSSVLEKYATFASSLLSILCLLVVILTYMSIPVLRAKIPGKIVLSLSLSLLLSHFLFLFSLQPTGLVCRVYAALHHAAWLSCFTWQTAMSLHLSYTLHNSSLEETCHSTFLFLSLLCWGLPLLLATVCFFMDLYDIVDIGYGQNGICWIGSFTSSLIIFSAPVALCVISSLACSVRVICAIRKSATFRRIHASSYSSLKREIILCVNLSLLMGLDWLFYVLTLPVDMPYLWIPFLVCHGSQGLFIFLCFVAKRYTINLLCATFCE